MPISKTSSIKSRTSFAVLVCEHYYSKDSYEDRLFHDQFARRRAFVATTFIDWIYCALFADILRCHANSTTFDSWTGLVYESERAPVSFRHRCLHSREIGERFGLSVLANAAIHAVSNKMKKSNVNFLVFVNVSLMSRQEFLLMSIYLPDFLLCSRWPFICS